MGRIHTAAQSKRDASRRRQVREAALAAISDVTRDKRGRPRRALRRELKRGSGSDWGVELVADSPD